MNDETVILVTNCDKGIGIELVKLLLEQESVSKIYAIAKELDVLNTLVNDDRLFVKQFNGSHTELKGISDWIKKDGTKLDVLVHCENECIIAPIEETSSDDIKSLFEMNTLNVIYLTTKILPMMVEQKSGHIIFVSSMESILGVPYKSVYSATKFAIDGYGESIKEELKKYNINVSMVKTGPLTDEQQMIKTVNDDENYDKFCQRIASTRETMSQTSNLVANKILKVITEKDVNNFRYFTNKIYSDALYQVYKEQPVQL